MKIINSNDVKYEEFYDEFFNGSGVVLIKNVFSHKQIETALEVVNKYRVHHRL